MLVIGAGPGGIITALELANCGFDVCLVESGDASYCKDTQRLGDAAKFDPKRHAPMNLATRRQVGGASNIWGGRIVPYDPINFEERDFIPFSDWPVRYQEIKKYHQRACDYFFCGKANFSTLEIDEISQKTVVPGLPDGEIRSTDLERWSLPTNFRLEYTRQLEAHPRIEVLTGFTCTSLKTSSDDSRILAAEVCSIDGEKRELTADTYVLACGCLETTRILMCSGNASGGLGNQSGFLGRLYMGHISGRLATVRFNTKPSLTHFGFLRDAEGVYVRPRFTFRDDLQRNKKITNIAIWLANPPVADHNHQNGVLSLVYLLLACPLGRFFASEAIRKSALKLNGTTSVSKHIVNMLRNPLKTFAFIPTFGIKRFLVRRKIPGFFQYSKANCYDLHYHGEQIPNWDSRVYLSDQVDRLGMRRLAIDYQFHQQDVDSIVEAHRLLDEYLRRHSIGSLEYLADDLEQSVWDQAADGYHQVGTTRMSTDPSQGVVDPDCKVHGVENLYLASASSFVTSGQANTTFLIGVFALRLSEHLSKTFRS